MSVLHFKLKKKKKTPWEKRYKNSINNMLFGKPKKNSRWMYLLIIALIILLGFLLR